MQKVEFFKPDDFKEKGITYDNYPERISELANKKLQEYLESCPRVYGKRGEDRSIYCAHYMLDGYNFIAKLLVIKEIIKNPCEHPAGFLCTFPDKPGYARCGICNKELQAEWKELK